MAGNTMLSAPFITWERQVINGGCLFSRFIKSSQDKLCGKNLAEAAISSAGHGLRPDWKAVGRDVTARQRVEMRA